MSTIIISSNTLRETKRLFGRLKNLRCTLPVLRHVLLTAGPEGIRLAATDLDHWLETRVCDDAYEPLHFLIPPEAMEAGRRLACCPATVPPQAFILPNGACHILGHPDFTADLATITWIDHEEPEHRRVAIRCGRHHLVSKPIDGNYPNYKQVIPAHSQELAVIPHDRKPGLSPGCGFWAKTKPRYASTGTSAASSR